MISLKLNNINIDIDNETAIGLTLQSYDIKEPCKPKVAISNTFSIPKTNKNLLAIGYGGNPQFFSDIMYNAIETTFICNNEFLVYKAKSRIEKITEKRIELFIFNKNDFWDEIKKIKFLEIKNDFLDFLKTNYNVNCVSNKFVGSFNSFITKYLSTDSGILFTFVYSNLYPSEQSDNNIILSKEVEKDGVLTNILGIYTFVFFKTFFEFLEKKFNVQFSIYEDFEGNAFLDSYVLSSSFFIPLVVRYDNGYYFDFANENDYLENIKNPFKDISLHKIIDTFFKCFNLVIDYKAFENDFKYKIYRFDEVLNIKRIFNWSNNIVKIKEFAPHFNDLAQNNMVRYLTVPEGFSIDYGGTNIICKNKNLNAETTKIEIDAFAFGFIKYQNVNIANLSEQKAFDKITIAIITNAKIYCNFIYNNSQTNVNVHLINLYDLNNEYQIIRKAYEYPQVWKIEKVISSKELQEFTSLGIYFFEQLGGSFIINKIENYNPLNPLQAANLEIIKISDITIKKDVENVSNYWIDGVGNIFVDGINEPFTFYIPN